MLVHLSSLDTPLRPRQGHPQRARRRPSRLQELRRCTIYTRLPRVGPETRQWPRRQGKAVMAGRKAHSTRTSVNAIEGQTVSLKRRMVSIATGRVPPLAPRPGPASATSKPLWPLLGPRQHFEIISTTFSVPRRPSFIYHLTLYYTKFGRAGPLCLRAIASSHCLDRLLLRREAGMLQ